ncbi:unnamed protein product [Notodromas monacha]|uniref:Uncharacterized protein n=1 Tax=Notodromas monacha TaxID=399045 RepID=A0A7R9BM74_9CRUS|nr:unnamed protein product [Notodromas monacha]CAG0916738.1 unnamed protein product [Notodromas monacha]
MRERVQQYRIDPHQGSRYFRENPSRRRQKKKSDTADKLHDFMTDCKNISHAPDEEENNSCIPLPFISSYIFRFLPVYRDVPFSFLDADDDDDDDDSRSISHKSRQDGIDGAETRPAE